MSKIQGEYKLELNFSGNKIFLNYWDSRHGNDVCCLIKNGKLYNMKVEPKAEITEISLAEFIDLVKESVIKK